MSAQDNYVADVLTRLQDQVEAQADEITYLKAHHERVERRFEVEALKLRELLSRALAEFDALYYTPTEPRGLLAQDIRAAIAKAEGTS